MQTFSLSLALNCTAVIAQNFLDEARKEAQDPNASLFLKTIQDKFPEDDDQFMLAIVKNAYRTTLRRGLLNFMSGSGVGGSVSPVQIISEGIMQPKAYVSEVASNGDAQQLRIEKDSDDVLLDGVDPQAAV